MHTIDIRKACERDLPRIKILASQLGYDCAPNDLADRLTFLLDRQDHHIVVAELGDQNAFELVAFAHFKKHLALLTDASLEVTGLVVHEKYRGLGISRRLMDTAEELAKEWNVKSVRLTSNIKRSEAHRFYLGLCYEQPKTSHFFIKRLA